MQHGRHHAVIFDMDGVIIDSEPIYIEIERELCSNLGVQLSDAEHEQFVGSPAVLLWEFVARRASSPIAIPELIDSVHERMRDRLNSADELTPMDGLLPLLDRLAAAGLRLAVASSSPPQMIELIVTRLGIVDRFELLLSGYEVANGKPAPDIFVEAARRLAVEPRQCSVIEDSANGVSAARAAGMRCIALRNHGSGRQDLTHSDAVVASLQDIDLRLLFPRTHAGS